MTSTLTTCQNTTSQDIDETFKRLSDCSKKDEDIDKTCKRQQYFNVNDEDGDETFNRQYDN